MKRIRSLETICLGVCAEISSESCSDVQDLGSAICGPVSPSNRIMMENIGPQKPMATPNISRKNVWAKNGFYQECYGIQLCRSNGSNVPQSLIAEGGSRACVNQREH